eukprot:1035855-Amphidinium_carterae.3
MVCSQNHMYGFEEFRIRARARMTRTLAPRRHSQPAASPSSVSRGFCVGDPGGLATAASRVHAQVLPPRLRVGGDGRGLLYGNGQDPWLKKTGAQSNSRFGASGGSGPDGKEEIAFSRHLHRTMAVRKVTVLVWTRLEGIFNTGRFRGSGGGDPPNGPTPPSGPPDNNGDDWYGWNGQGGRDAYQHQQTRPAKKSTTIDRKLLEHSTRRP